MFSSRISGDLAPNRLSEVLHERRAAGQPVIDLTESNPTRVGLDYPKDLLAPLADCRGLAYAPQPFGILAARRAVAGDYQRRGIAIAPERVALTASTSEAYSLLFKLLAAPGDDILVPRPSYPLFEHLTALDGVVARPYDLEYNGVWSIDFPSVERALGPRTRAILIVNPNNPTGSFSSQDELDRLAACCARLDLALIADEVFADYELEPGAAGGVAPVLSREDVLVFALGGLSKSIGLPQVKLGWIAVSGPERVVHEALQRLEVICDTYLSVSTPVQLAAADLFDRGSAIRAQITARITANYRQLKAQAADLPWCRVLNAAGGWSAIIQVPTLRSEEDLVIDLVSQAGVVAHPGYFFDFPRESFLILSLLPQEQSFADGVGRLLAQVVGAA
ncbi:MAG: pyridoxal phosphate-dependent aminotransferase [Acidobacteriota bacterium]